jgi:hypothetical protein
MERNPHPSSDYSDHPSHGGRISQMERRLEEALDAVAELHSEVNIVKDSSNSRRGSK